MTMPTSSHAYKPGQTPAQDLSQQVSSMTAPRTLMLQILGSFAEMPGLSLYPSQAARLFGEPEAVCCTALDLLVVSGHLRRCPDGQYRSTF
jgi:hypothetical protein